MTSEVIEHAEIPYPESRFPDQRLAEIEHKFPKLADDLRKGGWQLVENTLSTPGSAISSKQINALISHAMAHDWDPLFYLVRTDEELGRWDIPQTHIDLFDSCMAILRAPYDLPPTSVEGMDYLLED